MLTKILNENDCAGCRLCCGFFKSEIWEVPVIDDDLARLIDEKYIPGAEYDFIGSGRVFKAGYDQNGICFCPALGENGCVLEGDKPFDCKIWPFRVMKLGGFNVIALSPLCKKVNEKPLSELVRFVDEELTEKIKARFPARIKDYVKGYVILKVL